MKKLGLTIKNLRYLIRFSFQNCPQMLIIDGLFGATVALSTVLFIIMPKIILSAVSQHSSAGYILLLVLLFAGAEMICQYLLSFFSELSGVYNEKMAHDMLLSLSEKATRIDYGDMKSNELIEKYQHAQNVTFQIDLYLAQLFCDCFSNLIKIITVMAVISTISLWMVGVIMLIVVIKLLVADYSKKRDVEFQKKADRINVHYNYAVTLAGHPAFAKEMRCYQAEDFVIGKYHAARERKLQNEARKVRLHHLVNLPEHLLDVIAVASGYALLVHQYINGFVDITVFTMYLAAITETYNTVAELMRVLVNLNDTNRLMQQYMEFLQYPEKISGSGMRKEIPAAENGSYKIEFRNVSFRYPHSDQYALHHVNASFHLGERIGIVGENGAGKTTFVKLLLRLYDADEGEILLNGVNIKEIDYETYLHLFSVVPQDYALFFFSIQENVGFEKSRDEAGKVRRVLNDVRMLEQLEALPKGLETFTSKWFQGGADFSGGERQRIAIARGLFRETPVMVLDEPSAAIDPLAEEQIYETIRSISSDKLVFHISHRLSMTKECDQILVFQNGTVTEHGDHASLMKQEGIYQEMFRLQAQYYVQTEEGRA